MSAVIETKGLTKYYAEPGALSMWILIFTRARFSVSSALTVRASPHHTNIARPHSQKRRRG
jgi:hypothetical protein